MRSITFVLLLISLVCSKESIIINSTVNKNDLSIISATAIMYLDQHIDDIFKKITDFSNYHKNINVISKSQVYYENNNSIHLKMTTNTLAMFSLVNHFEHKVYKNIYKVVWKLDDTKENILEYAKGQWELEKLSNNTTKVVYHNSIKPPIFMPSIISNYLMEEGVKDSTLWLMKNISK